MSTRVGKGAGLLRFLAVDLEDVLRLLADVRQFRHAGLHAEGHLILLDARVRFGIADLLVVQLIERVAGHRACGGGRCRERRADC